MHSSKPTVSIGIPVFNGEPFVEQTIESVIAQTFEDFELVISDNASTDETEAICRDYAAKDGRIRYGRNAENIGAARNFNKVYESSSGKYFKWAAADNMIAPTFLEKCVEVLEEDPSAVLAYTRHTMIDEIKNAVYKSDLNYDLESPLVLDRFYNIITNAIGATNDVIWGLLRSEILRKTSLIRTYTGSDNCLLLDLILRGKFVEIPEYLLTLRIHHQGFHAMKIQFNEGKFDRQQFYLERAKWFDPATTGRFLVPRCMILLKYIMVVIRSQVDPAAKIAMLDYFFRSIIWERKELAEEVRNALRQMFLSYDT